MNQAGKIDNLTILFYLSLIWILILFLQMSLLLQSEGIVTDNFNIHYVTIIDKISALRIIPKGFNPKMEALAKPVTGEPVDKKSKRMSVPMETTPLPVSLLIYESRRRTFNLTRGPLSKIQSPPYQTCLKGHLHITLLCL